jgi:hypothetical protein
VTAESSGAGAGQTVFNVCAIIAVAAVACFVCRHYGGFDCVLRCAPLPDGRVAGPGRCSDVCCARRYCRREVSAQRSSACKRQLWRLLDHFTRPLGCCWRSCGNRRRGSGGGGGGNSGNSGSWARYHRTGAEFEVGQHSDDGGGDNGDLEAPPATAPRGTEAQLLRSEELDLSGTWVVQGTSSDGLEIYEEELILRHQPGQTAVIGECRAKGAAEEGGAFADDAQSPVCGQLLAPSGGDSGGGAPRLRLTQRYADGQQTIWEGTLWLRPRRQPAPSRSPSPSRPWQQPRHPRLGLLELRGSWRGAVDGEFGATQQAAVAAAAAPAAPPLPWAGASPRGSMHSPSSSVATVGSEHAGSPVRIMHPPWVLITRSLRGAVCCAENLREGAHCVSLPRRKQKRGKTARCICSRRPTWWCGCAVLSSGG